MANSSPVYDWFQERLEIQDIADDIGTKYVPPHVNIFYCLGGITLGLLPDPVRDRVRDDLLLQAHGCGGIQLSSVPDDRCELRVADSLGASAGAPR